MFPQVDQNGHKIQSGVFNLATQKIHRVNTTKRPQGSVVNSWVGVGSEEAESRKQLKSRKCGINAIDNYYDMLDFKEEAECLRQSTEFRRLITMIQSHWKAKRYPRCE